MSVKGGLCPLIKCKFLLWGGKTLKISEISVLKKLVFLQGEKTYIFARYVRKPLADMSANNVMFFWRLPLEWFIDKSYTSCPWFVSIFWVITLLSIHSYFYTNIHYTIRYIYIDITKELSNNVELCIITKL